MGKKVICRDSLNVLCEWSQKINNDMMKREIKALWKPSSWLGSAFGWLRILRIITKTRGIDRMVWWVGSHVGESEMGAYSSRINST